MRPRTLDSSSKLIVALSKECRDKDSEIAKYILCRIAVESQQAV
jgi:hypothetical protein